MLLISDLFPLQRPGFPSLTPFQHPSPFSSLCLSQSASFPLPNAPTAARARDAPTLRRRGRTGGGTRGKLPRPCRPPPSASRPAPDRAPGAVGPAKAESGRAPSGSAHGPVASGLLVTRGRVTGARPGPPGSSESPILLGSRLGLGPGTVCWGAAGAACKGARRRRGPGPGGGACGAGSHWAVLEDAGIFAGAGRSARRCPWQRWESCTGCDPRDPCLRMSSPQAVHAADSRVGVRVTEITREFTLNGFGIFVCILKSKNFVACQTFREVVPTARGGWNHASRWLAG